MTHFVVDTNVPVVANGRDGDYDLNCRLACVEQIDALRKHLRHRVVLDCGGAILDEYHRHLNPRGQPGVGDEFYRYLLNHCGNPKRVTRVKIERDQITDEYVDFPDDPELANFDRSDRKFVAAALAGRAVVLNATDSDWWQFRISLQRAGVKVRELCPQCVGE